MPILNYVLFEVPSTTEVDLAGICSLAHWEVDTFALTKGSRGSIVQVPPPADSGGGNMEIAARERYVWYGSREPLRTCSHCAVTKEIFTWMFSWCLTDTTKLKLAASKKRSESDVIHQLCRTEYLFRSFSRFVVKKGTTEVNYLDRPSAPETITRVCVLVCSPAEPSAFVLVL